MMTARALAVVLGLALSVHASAAGTPRFVPEGAAPYFTSGPAALAAAALRREEWREVARGFADYVQANPKAADARQAAFLAAWAELKTGQFDAAARRFDELAKSYPLLHDYHLAWAARAHLAAGRATEALARAKRVPPASALDGDVRLLRAEAERALAHPERAAEELRGYLAAYPASWREPEARFRLGEALDLTGHHAEAVAEWRRVYLHSPCDAWGKQAEGRVQADPGTFAAPELVTRATALFDNMRNAESEAEWQKVLAAPALTEELACVARFHVAQSVFKQRERTRAAPLFDAAAEACAKVNEDLAAKALYQGGRSFSTRGDKDVPAARKGLERFERVWREHPAHSYADDARLRAAEVYDELKEPARATELYKGIPEAFPAGDQKGEALWRLAFRALRKNDLVGAKEWLETELARLPREDGWWEAGRTLYWLGRVADRAKDPARATEYWQRAAREYPLSYYALLALNRLRERTPEEAGYFIDELAADPGDPKGWELLPRPLYGTPAFQRGLELARLGLGPEAKRELALAGLRVPSRRGEAVADPELAWAAAVLYDRAGEHSISHFIPQWVLTEWRRAWPVGEARKRWLLAYPRGYGDLIAKHARLNGLPEALEFAIVREESGFDPLMESFANAIGLTQLTAAPAERFAGGLPHDRAALRDPAINVTIGARELADVYTRYDGGAPFAIAAYNAGAGAVNRWLRDPERSGLALDEWVEAIPYDETRGYTKRVLSSYFAYTWLSESRPRDRVPVLSFVLPRKR